MSINLHFKICRDGVIGTILQCLRPLMLSGVVKLNTLGFPLDEVIYDVLWFDGLDAYEFSRCVLRNINRKYQLIGRHACNLHRREVGNECK